MTTASVPLSPIDRPSLAWPPAGLHGRERRLLMAGIAAVHLVAGWGLLQMAPVRQALREAAPLMVSLLSIERAPEPPPPLPAPPRARMAPTATAMPVPLVVLAPTPQPAAPVAAALEAPSSLAPSPGIHVTPAPPAPPAPPPAKQLPPTAVRYLVPPAIEVPMASRRLGETGTVLLRVLIDANGLPRQVTLHKSSGHARLDEQALQAMRAARFRPYTENGTAIEGYAIAALQYDID